MPVGHEEGLFGAADDVRPPPMVTTGSKPTSAKAQATGAYAKALAERGFVVLAFDHRYFGESDGAPRQFENPTAQIRDIRAAVAALRDYGPTAGASCRGGPGVRRRWVHGTCHGGGARFHGIRRRGRLLR